MHRFQENIKMARISNCNLTLFPFPIKIKNKIEIPKNTWGLLVAFSSERIQGKFSYRISIMYKVSKYCIKMLFQSSIPFLPLVWNVGNKNEGHSDFFFFGWSANLKLFFSHSS
jgi:hypothetical protein